jgi:GntR family histidine utilization transcriptional repressor
MQRKGREPDQRQYRAPKQRLPLAPPLALYQQVKKHILDQIESGELQAGMRIPSEHQLVDTLGVSRMTVNRAIRELTEEGVVTRSQGVGSFVAEQKPFAGLLEVLSIADEIKRAGGEHSCDVHLLKKETAPQSVAWALEIRPGGPVFHSIFVHKSNGVPVQLAERWVNPAVAPHYLEQDYTEITPNEYLQMVAPLQEAQHVLEAILPDKESQRLLKIGAREPCILLLRRTWALGQVATDNRFIYPGSRFRLGGRFEARGGPALI